MIQQKLEKKQSFVKPILSNITALTFGLLMAFVLGEILTRVFLPIFPGITKLDENGEEIFISNVQPDTVYRQYAEEFDVITTITKDGYRVPEVKGDPDIIFIGDSFTFGQGLKDEDTFVMQYCKKAQLSCMNLGMPGLGTIEEVERLGYYLKEFKVRPKKVYLSILAMTSFLGSGNDLNDNLEVLEKREAKASGQHKHAEESQSLLRTVAEVAFRDSNFARVIKFYFMPVIKNLIVIKPEESRLDNALLVMEKQLKQFDQLSKDYSFEYKIILFHPVQDISRATQHETIKQIQKIAPIPIISSAKLLEDNPEQYYFSMDGHFNVKGSEKIVELLLSLPK